MPVDLQESPADFVETLTSIETRGSSPPDLYTRTRLRLLKSVVAERNYKIIALLVGVLAVGLVLELLSVTLWKAFLETHAELKEFLTLMSHAFVTAALIGIVYDLFTRGELVQSFLVKLEDLNQSFTRTVSHESKAIRESLPLIIINPENVGHLISEETARAVLPVIVERVCQSSDVREAVLQTITSHQGNQGITWRNLHHAIEIRPLTREEWLWRNAEECLELHDRISYTTHLQKSTFMFVCCRNPDDYELYEFNNDYDSVWHMPQSFADEEKEGSCNTFDIYDFRIGNMVITGEQFRENADTIVYKYIVPENRVNQEIRVSYTVNTVLRKKSHFYRVRATVLTKGMRLRADIDGTLATAIKVPDFFPGAFRTFAQREDNRLWTEVETEDWIFPGQGVAIVWE